MATPTKPCPVCGLPLEPHLLMHRGCARAQQLPPRQGVSGPSPIGATTVGSPAARWHLWLWLAILAPFGLATTLAGLWISSLSHGEASKFTTSESPPPVVNVPRVPLPDAGLGVVLTEVTGGMLHLYYPLTNQRLVVDYRTLTDRDMDWPVTLSLLPEPALLELGKRLDLGPPLVHMEDTIVQDNSSYGSVKCKTSMILFDYRHLSSRGCISNNHFSGDVLPESHWNGKGLKRYFIISVAEYDDMIVSATRDRLCRRDATAWTALQIKPGQFGTWAPADEANNFVGLYKIAGGNMSCWRAGISSTAPVATLTRPQRAWLRWYISDTEWSRLKLLSAAWGGPQVTHFRGRVLQVIDHQHLLFSDRVVLADTAKWFENDLYEADLTEFGAYEYTTVAGAPRKVRQYDTSNIDDAQYEATKAALLAGNEAIWSEVRIAIGTEPPVAPAAPVVPVASTPKARPAPPPSTAPSTAKDWPSIIVY